MFGCAERAAQSDLACSLPHRHEHDGQNTDRPKKERDTRNRWNEPVQSCGGFTLDLEEDGLRAMVQGWEGAPQHLVKGATYHRLCFERTDAGWRARVVLDV